MTRRISTVTFRWLRLIWWWLATFLFGVLVIVITETRGASTSSAPFALASAAVSAIAGSYLGREFFGNLREDDGRGLNKPRDRFGACVGVVCAIFAFQMTSGHTVSGGILLACWLGIMAMAVNLIDVFAHGTGIGEIPPD